MDKEAERRKKKKKKSLTAQRPNSIFVLNLDGKIRDALPTGLQIWSKVFLFVMATWQVENKIGPFPEHRLAHFYGPAMLPFDGLWLF